MPLPAPIAALTEAAAYPHACANVELLETHISWIFLTGEFAYKVKKPVALNFVDFSTLARREHFCREELRCNRAFAPELYLDVVPINEVDGKFVVAGPGPIVEWAVKMVQFPTDKQLDRLLEAGHLERATMQAFGASLAATHQSLPVSDAPLAVEQRVLKPVVDNFRTLRDTLGDGGYRPRLQALEERSLAAFGAQRGLFDERAGWVRECHGDLHLSNLVLMPDGVRAFDCLEFNPDLRWIDVASDLAFLQMDCSVRERADLAFAVLDGYLNVLPDYGGVVLSPFYQAYRSVVRAKVAALQLANADPADGGLIDTLQRRVTTHLDWAEWRLGQAPGAIVLMCGLSGSGKSYVAERLVPELPAVRLRSDVLRKWRAGLGADSRSGSELDSGLYQAQVSQLVYEELADAALAIAVGGDSVIVDATYLHRDQRQAVLERARSANVSCVVAYCDAPQDVLQARITQRLQDPRAVSEAGLEVLARQRQVLQLPQAEPVVAIDTTQELDYAALGRRLREHLGNG